MPKWKELTSGEKFIKAGLTGTGFIMGSIVGGTVSDCMKNSGWGNLISSATGVAITTLYTLTFDVCSDSVIIQNRFNKVKDADVPSIEEVEAALKKSKDVTENKSSGRFAWGEGDDKED